MRSRKLHRDEDMMEDALRSKVAIVTPHHQLVIINALTLFSFGCTLQVCCNTSSHMMPTTVD